MGPQGIFWPPAAPQKRGPMLGDRRLSLLILGSFGPSRKAYFTLTLTSANGAGLVINYHSLLVQSSNLSNRTCLCQLGASHRTFGILIIDALIVIHITKFVAKMLQAGIDSYASMRCGTSRYCPHALTLHYHYGPIDLFLDTIFEANSVAEVWRIGSTCIRT